jgi:hypothetical protein
MGVFVLGMHRSGTSAVTRVVNLLGVPIGRVDRLMPVRPDNPAGFWEHLALMDVNDAVLERLGGSWDAPPQPDATVASRADFADLRGKARDEFDATYEGDRWVFKDPRVSLLLPFWRAVLDDPNHHVAMIVLRNPLDIAASLARRDQFAVPYSLALWEHYTRAALRDAAGLPVLVVDYDELVDDGARGTDALHDFLGAHDQLEGDADRGAIGAFLAAGLRHSRHGQAEVEQDERVTDEQRRLCDATAALVGRHDRFDIAIETLPAVSPSTPSLIEARRSPATPERSTLDAITRLLGTTEAGLQACEREREAMRGTFDAVDATLGYTAIGRLERAALGAARRARRVQERFSRR